MARKSSDISSKKVSDVQVTVNGGFGTNSYFKHSSFQKLAANVSKDKIDDTVARKLDVKSLLLNSNTIRLADLGCAVGPNTLTTMQELIEVIKQNYHSQCPTLPTPEFQVFFNDQPNNDFNTLFASLPKEKEYFASGVPGSFYQRLFPEAFLHLVHCAFALHWLSRAPEELEDKNSLAWNKGRIHYSGAPCGVLKAYARQWGNDLNDFLEARAKEIVAGGLLVVVMPSIPDGMPYSELANGIMYDCMASILLDMAKKGLITEEEVDSFNLPIYAAPPGEFSKVVEKNGYFSIEGMDLINPAPWLSGEVHIDMIEFTMHIRAAMEGMFTKHFSIGVVDELFHRLGLKLAEISEQLESAYKDKIQAYYVLQRK